VSRGFLVYSNSTMCRDGLVIGAGANVGALLVDGLGDGVFLEAADQEFEFLRDTSFNLLQGCRMRNTKTVGSCFFWFI
jgi:(E)-4-hydroxy-3-methylbut-2-enyl-diphosphate synthase